MADKEVGALSTGVSSQGAYFHGVESGNSRKFTGSQIRGSFRGALATKTAAQNVNNNSNTVITFDAEDYDTDAFHDNSINPSRMTVHTGISKVRLSAVAVLSDEVTAAAHSCYASFIKNGSSSFNGHTVQSDIGGAVDALRAVNIVSPVLSVSVSEYFEVNVYQASGETLSATTACWFAMEVIE